MYILIGNLGLIATWLITVSSIDYGDVDPSEARPMPPEIAAMFGNKSDFDIEIEECMKDFVECMGTIAFSNVTICASNAYGETQTFATMCDMFYENCKSDARWGYFQDDACTTK